MSPVKRMMLGQAGGESSDGGEERFFSRRQPRTIREVQAVVGRYKYNIDGATYDVDKDRSLAELFDTAEEILDEPTQPIQCVEAAFLALHLTHGLDVVRFPISFHSKAFKDGCGPFPKRQGGGGAADSSDDSSSDSDEREYEIVNHLVIGLYRRGLFGAVGISRNTGLQSKPLAFTSFADMIWDFAQHYRRDRHVLLSVRLGCAVDHTTDPAAYNPVWRAVEIKLSRWHRLFAERRLAQFQEQLIAAAVKQGALRGSAPRLSATQASAQEGSSLPMLRANTQRALRS